MPIIIQPTEKYHCSQCEDYFTYLQVFQTWRCPTCNNLISTKILIDGSFYDCHRVWLEILFHKHKLYSPVQRFIIADGFCIAKAIISYTIGFNSFRDQVIGNRFGTV